jgi:hypothetical protein
MSIFYCRSPLVNWGAYELGLDLTMGNLGENPHPFGQIPCLVDTESGATLFESGACLNYLENVANVNGATSKERGAILSWIAWANASLDPICFLETPDGKVYVKHPFFENVLHGSLTTKSTFMYSTSLNMELQLVERFTFCS